jgi:sulfur-oxidizing protein SoxY
MNSIRLVALMAASLLAVAQGRAEESEASRAARWHDVSAAIFHGRAVEDGSSMIQLDAPPRALDAALVPVAVTIRPDLHVTSLTLVVDDNPAPVAGIVHFGPLADPHLLRLRVRVDEYTLLHAVAELQDGRLVGTSRFIKAAGGCSAPGTGDQAEALARIGRMKLRPVEGPSSSSAQALELLISHPNANGMQMNPVTRLYTPARYVQTIRVSQGGQSVFSMDGDISLATDPAITFAYHPSGTAPLDVEVDDSAKTVFRQSFPVTPHAS